jgi:glutamine synthetase
MYKPGKEGATRVELRSPDPACNPYLAFAVMLAAGLKGVEQKYELPAEASDNIFEMTEKEREVAGIGTLPVDLYEAIKIAEKSELLREALGDHVFEYLLMNKKAEWDIYKAQVTEYEIKKYLSTL